MAQLRSRYANRKCEEIMGYTRDEFYADDFKFLDLIAPEYADLIMKIVVAEKIKRQ